MEIANAQVKRQWEPFIPPMISIHMTMNDLGIPVP